jgi:hypothetical protein
MDNVRSYTNSENDSSFLFNKNSERDFSSWIIDTFDKTTSENKNTYLIIDTIFNEAFSHWVFESAIYLDLFLLLKEKYPTIKLQLKTKRTFKLLFCRLFNIDEEDIVYTLEPSNISFFPSPISLMNNKELPQEYIEQLRVFFLKFNQYKSTEVSSAVLIIPRQTKENYHATDLSYNFDTLGECLKSRSYEFFHTDSVTDLKDQIYKVSSASTIILTDGSPFLVNAMFAKNARIMIVDTRTIDQSIKYPKLKKVIDNSKELNNISYEYYNTVDDLAKYLLSQ